MNQRIKPIDGLRAFAVLGVVWIHAWIFCNNVPLNLFSVDIYKLVAVAGNGVDFFFVISGFCMYLMIDKSKLTISYYLHFLYKRFLRIAPAYFISVLVYAVIVKTNNPGFPFLYNVIFHFLFLNNVVTGNTISGPFWSIGVEWHFYIILPVVILLSRHISLVKTVVILSVLCLLFFGYINSAQLDVSWWENQILVRFPEFGLGIIAAYFFLSNKKIPSALSGSLGLLCGCVVLYLGRIMMFTPLLVKAGSAGFILKTLSYTVMTSGFTFILYHVITKPSVLSRFLSTPLLVYIGKISYSIYLWHSLAFITLWKLLYTNNPTAIKVVIVFVCVSILSVIFAAVSYKYLESFYFKMAHRRPFEKQETEQKSANV